MRQFKSLNIYIVDEDIQSRARYKAILAELGFENSKEICCGKECLQQLSNDPEVIILDQGKNPAEGIETLKKIKELHPGVYVVFVTDREHLQTPLSAQKFGAFDYFHKGYREESSLHIVMQKILNVMDMLAKKPPKTQLTFYNL